MKMETLSVNLDKILAELGEQRRFFTHKKLKKCRTKSVAHRLSSFGISFNSRGKLDFFPVSLFAVVIGFFDDRVGFCGSNDQLVELHDGHACEEQFSVFFKILGTDQAGRLFFGFDKRQFFHKKHLADLIFL